MQLKLEKGKIKITFHYSPEKVTQVKKIPGAKWNPNKKEWSVTDCAVTRAFLNHVAGTDLRYTNRFPDSNVSLPEPSRKPFEHQRRMTAAIVSAYKQERGLALFCEPGTGKTKAVVDAINSIKPESVLIVCPNPIIEVWKEELAIEGLSAEIIHGPRRKIPVAGINVTTYGTLRNDIKKYGNKAIKIKFDMVIFDESHVLSQPSSKQSKACKKLESRSKLILTGTPSRNSKLDAAFQMLAMDSSVFGDRQTILGAFAVFGGYEDREIVGLKNQGMYDKIIKTNAISLRKKDCLHSLPPKVYSIVPLPMGSEQLKVYERVIEGGLYDEPITNQLTGITKLRQISSGFVYYDNQVIRFKDNLKLEYLKSISWNTPTIIWTNFRAEIEDIRKALGKTVKLAVIEGGVGVSKKVAQFESGEVDLIVAPMKTISYGVTMNRASRVIFYSPSFSQADTKQAEDRCHRIGQQESVTYIKFVSSPLEKLILKILERKSNVRDELLKINLIKTIDNNHQ